MYIEYYFIENLLINYIIISCTTILTKTINTTKKKCIGSILGAIYSVLYIYPTFEFLFSIISKIIIMTIITMVSFSYRNKKEYIRIMIVFYLVNIFISGSTFFIIYFTGIKHTKISFLIISAYISCELLKYTYKDIKTLQYIKSLTKNISINLCGERIECTALIDSGNLLKDPISQNEVIVVKPSIVKKILNESILDEDFEIVSIANFEKVVSKLDDKLKSKVRVIPYQHAGNTNSGMLIGLKCDYIEVDNNKISNVFIAISNFYNDNCDAIINPILIQKNKGGSL